MSARSYVVGSTLVTLGLTVVVVSAELFGLGSFRFGLLAFTALAAPLLVLGALAATWRGTRALALPAISVGLIPLLLVYPSLLAASYARRSAFANLAERSSDLIAAIREYEKRHGVPPPNLAALVPEQIQRIPKTGMRAYPEYRYERSAATSLTTTRQPRWELAVECSTGGINADEFVYWPNEDYPTTVGAGDFERIGRWAYLHE